MSVEAQQLQTWIGAEVLDGAGQKLGKLEEVYFLDGLPLAVGIRSGLVGHKHRVATLRGATVSRDSLHLDAASATVPAGDTERLGAEQLTKLAAQDDRLLAVEPVDVEGWHARIERFAAEAQAQAEAEKLSAEASRLADEEKAANLRAGEADRAAEQARGAREDAEIRAQEARTDTELPRRPES